MVTRTGNALPRVQHAQLGKGRDVCWLSLETVSWGQVLQTAKCSHSLLSSVAVSNQKVLGVEIPSPTVYDTTLLSPQIFEVSWDCLRFEVTQMYAERLQIVLVPPNSTRGNTPSEKGEAGLAGSVPGKRCPPFLGVAQL